MNKRGDFTGLLYFIVVIAATAFFLIIGGYIATTLSSSIETQINSSDSRVNDQFQYTTDAANNTLSAVWYIVFGGLLLGLFITAWKIPTSPIYVVIFIILLVVAIIVGVALSNLYEDVYGVDEFSATAGTQGSINFVMSKLPYVALIVGIITLIITFAKPKEVAAPYM